MKRLSFFLMTVLWAASLLAADVPEVFIYQGRLLDEDGAPLGGAREAVFGVYDAPAGGSALWEQSTMIHADANGLFNVTLGGTTNSLLAAVGIRFDSLYLDMAFKISGVMEPVRPRPQFVSVPYARLADDVAGAQSLEVTGNLTAREKVALQTAQATRADLGSLQALRTRASQVTGSSIQPYAGSTSLSIQSPVVFHGFTTTSPVFLSLTSGAELSPDHVNFWRQAATDGWVSFSGVSKAINSIFVFKITPTRLDLAPSQYGSGDFRVTSFTTVRGDTEHGLCIPVPAGWWFGYYVYTVGYLGGTYNVSDQFMRVDFRWVEGP